MGEQLGGRWPEARSDADFAPLLAGKPDDSVAMFWRFIDLARAAGPAVFELQRDRVVLRGTRRIFGSARPVARGLAGHLNLPRQISDRRFGKTENLTQRLVFHRFLLTSLADLDDDFASWLAESRDAGDGRAGQGLPA